MALFQPTNIIPSSLIGQGTIDVNDTMEISWQVNGNSAMTAFQIDFYQNDTDSTPLNLSTKKISTYSFKNESGQTLSLPFYGTDRFGYPQFFTWNANGQTWEEWSKYQLTNGNEYKFKITQFYKGGNNYTITLSDTITVSQTRYFSFVDLSGQTQYVTFNAPDTLFSGYVIGYNNETDQAYFISGGITSNISNHTKSTTQPTGIQYLGEAVSEIEVAQNFFSVFTTKATPTLTINQTDENYLNPITLPATLATSIGYFQASFIQEQGDAIRWIRWQVAQATYNTQTEQWVLGEILADTGDIYTPTLNFEFNGFFNAQKYAIRCYGESESGQSCDSDWQYFTIAIENPGQYSGNFTAQCINKENAALLEWECVEVIPPTVSPDNYSPNISNGSVILNANSSITWNKQGENPMNFEPNWTAVWKGKISLQTEQRTVYVSGQVSFQRQFNGETYWCYSDTYTLIPNPTISKILKTQVVVNSDDTVYELIPQQSENGTSATIYLMTKSQFSPSGFPRYVSAQINYVFGEPVSPTGKIFSVSSNAGEILSINQNSDSVSNHFSVTIGQTQYLVPIQDVPTEISLVVSPNSLIAYFYSNGTFLSSTQQTVSYTQQPITSISILGGDVGATVDSVSVYQGDGSNILSLYQKNPDFEPVWNDEGYSLYMTANFNENLEGGTGTASGSGFRIYRQEVGTTTLTPIATVPSTTISLKDYGIVSRKAYQYFLYAYDNNGAFMSAVNAENAIATNFKNYSLLVCDYDQTNEEYHVRKQYLFGLNLADGSVGNNNSPTLNANFTQYPTRMPSTQNYASGTLSGLIGAIYTVPALIEQIGQYKYTAKPSTLDYFDSVDLEQELYSLSVAPYQLFLRDMKGRLRMIATSAPITMKTNLKQRQQSISISLPWVEVGDASDVTIIQTPDDCGWNNDNQVLDVQLDVDVATGELSAQYPFPYNGTKFYLTGANKEILTAKTPRGVTPAQFELSDTAEQPDDGELSATVKVNSEEDQ